MLIITAFCDGHSSLGPSENILGKHSIMYNYMNVQNVKWNDYVYYKNYCIDL